MATAGNESAMPPAAKQGEPEAGREVSFRSAPRDVHMRLRGDIVHSRVGRDEA